MSEAAQRFIDHLTLLRERDRGALATLRHSLAFDPGCYPKAYPYVERFVGHERSARDPWRLALYAVAGLYARHPQQRGPSFGTAFGELMQRRSKPREPNKSIEGRFVALLAADEDNILVYLRQAVSLLAADDIGFDYAQLLDDLSRWMSPAVDRDRLRQNWAREFYRAALAEAESESEIANAE